MTAPCFRCAASDVTTAYVGTLRPRDGGEYHLRACRRCLRAPAADGEDWDVHLVWASSTSLTGALPAPQRNPHVPALTW